MGRTKNIILFIVLILTFFLTSQSIVKVKMLQLKVLLAREQLLNYELSSRMLRAKFKQMLLSKDNFSTEMKMKVLESSILNFDDAEEFKLTLDEIAGLWIVNLVRKLSLKPFLKLQEDQNKLLLLQYAFYMERTRKYGIASKKYTDLEKKLRDSPGDNHAFVLLHNGYCLSLMGMTEDAIGNLERVQEEYEGTHYEENATILIKILREGQKRKDQIDKLYANDKDRGRALFSSGQYNETIEKFKNEKNLDTSDKYLVARSHEEIGHTNTAVTKYMELANQGKNQDIARKANRRLLMIGNFYGGGKKVAEYAEEKAKKLGDETILKDVKDGVALQATPNVIEKIKRKQSAKPDEAQDQDTVEQLQELKKELEETLVEDEKTVKTIVLKQEKIEKQVEIQKKINRDVKIEKTGKKDLQLTIVFLDGRKVFGKSLVHDDEFIIIYSGKYSIKLPYMMIQSVILEGYTGEQVVLQLLLDNDDIVPATAIDRENDILKISFNNKVSTIPDSDLLSVIPVIYSAGGKVNVLVRFKDGRNTHGRYLERRGDNIMVYSRTYHSEFPLDNIKEISMIPAAQASSMLNIKLTNGTHVSAEKLKMKRSKFKIKPSGEKYSKDLIDKVYSIAR